MALPVETEDILKRKWARTLTKQIDMVMAFRRDRDPRLVGLMRQIPPPPKLVEGIIKLSTMINMAESENWKTGLIILRHQLYRILDMFQKTPIPIEPLVGKGAATDRGEVEVMELPEGFDIDLGLDKDEAE